MLVHNDIRLYQALNKHIHILPRALCNLLQSCNDEVGKTEKHKVAVYNLKYWWITGQQPLSSCMGGHTEDKTGEWAGGSYAVQCNLCLPVQLSVAGSK